MRIDRRGFRVVLATLGLLFVVGAVSLAAEPQARRLGFKADEVLEKGMSATGVQRSASGDAVILYDSTLIEDDGPGIGPDADFLEEAQKAPKVIVGGKVRLKKVLNVPRSRALAARLYVPAGVSVEINGAAVQLTGDAKYPEIPATALKDGENVVVLSGPEGSKHPVKIARREAILRNAPERKDRPARSFQSVDGGQTWQTIDGEAMVRLHLLQYAEEGSVVSPVIDLGTDGDEIAPGVVSIRSIALTADADLPAGTSVQLLTRTGVSPVYEAASWGDWQAPDAAIPAERRYMQWKAVLKTSDAKMTPTLRKITLDAKVARDDVPAWAARVKVAESKNAEIRFTSIPYEYEDPFQPRMVALRNKYKLDEVVAGAGSEMEKLVKLRDWVSRQWKYKAPIEGGYPAWDADEILQRKAGFCVQYAIVYMQCAISLGYQARFVFGDHPGTIVAGHEVCEVWSNQYGKWIYMDPNNDQHYIDPATGVPLSMLETHDRLLRTFYPDKVATFENRPRTPAYSPLIGICQGLSLTPQETHSPGEAPPKEWETWTKWLHVRYMPRNNFFAKPTPVPVAQGFHWDWSDYWIWYDDKTPRDWCYRNFASRRTDVDWTINQVRYAAAYGAKEGSVAIQMGTHTPYFETYLINVDGEGWKPSPRMFNLDLHSGANRLEMRVRNTSDVEGPISSMRLDYAGAK